MTHTYRAGLDVHDTVKVSKPEWQEAQLELCLLSHLVGSPEHWVRMAAHLTGVACHPWRTDIEGNHPQTM